MKKETRSNRQTLAQHTCSGLGKLLPLSRLLKWAFILSDVWCQRVFPGSRWWQFAYLTSAQHIRTHTRAHTSTIQTSTTRRENKQIHTLPIPTPPSDGSRYTACMHKLPLHKHTSPCDKRRPVSTMTSVLFPADERGTADDRLIERSSSLSHPSFQPVYHLLAVQSICWEERETHLGRPWPSSHPEGF